METPTDRRPLKSRSLGWVQALARLIVRAKIMPNAISGAGVVFAALAALLLIAGTRMGVPSWLGLVIAALCVQARLMCNLLDGMVAVEGGLKSKGGDLFNEIPDRIEDSLFLIGAGYCCGNPTTGWACALLAVTTAYLRAFGASLGHGQDFIGPGAKPQRMFILTVALVAQAVAIVANQSWNILAWALWLIVGLTAITAILRTGRLYRKSS
jgi:phosphatidylglycerophosphate synthase